MLSQIGDFFANYWWILLILLLVILLFAVIRGVRKALKEGGGAFNLETIRKNTAPNREYVKQKAQAMLKDADMVCEVSGTRVIPKREDIPIFRAAIKSRYKVAMFLVEKENKVAYFFCRTEQGLQRRIGNLMLDKQKKNTHWPYSDRATGERLRFPKV